MKFTKKEMRKAIKKNNQTKVWKLCAIKLGRTPTKIEVCKLVDAIANTEIGRKITIKYAVATLNGIGNFVKRCWKSGTQFTTEKNMVGKK